LSKQTKAQRSASAKKAAATRKRKEVKDRSSDLKKAAGVAAHAAKDLGVAAVSAARDTAKSVSKQADSSR
jgi:hypothetical protein